MGKKKKEQARVLSKRRIAPDIYDMWIETELAKEAKAGQFIGVYPENAAHLLPRPISICETDRERNALRIVYRVTGKGTGTEEFASWQEGQKLAILGILGNGFPVEKSKGKKVVLMGGGIGIPPMLALFKELKEIGTEAVMIAGYRDARLFLKEELEQYGEVYVATEDGSAGRKGNVLDVMKQEGLQAQVIMACGPMPMLRAVKYYAQEQQMEAFISLEERMACGVGACLGCVCKTTRKDPHSHVNHARICTDGPVFDAREVEI